MMLIRQLVRLYSPSVGLLYRRKINSPTALFLSMTSKTAEERKFHDNKEERIVWVDLEMSGLDIDTDHILEMACLVTDADLNVIAETDDIVINQPENVLENMNDWCKEHHGKSGLTESVRNSKISLAEAEDTMLKFVQDHTIKGKSPLAGNSIHADRMFLSKYMPRFTDHLHYRIIDVSTIKELTRRWYPKEFQGVPKKKLSHRALDDIKESIQELQFYRASIFKL